MRRSRSLTMAEQWDVGLLLAFFMVSMLCLTVIWRSGAVPRLVAFAFHRFGSAAVQTDEGPCMAPAGYSALQVGAAAAQGVADVIAPGPAVPVVEREPARPKAAVETRIFNGVKYVCVKTIRMRVTAYAADSRCCWPYAGNTTASGESVRSNGGRLAAADTRVIPFYSLVSVPGYHGGQAVPVLDRGGAIKGRRLDILLPTYEAAQRWGSRMLDVKVYEPRE